MYMFSCGKHYYGIFTGCLFSFALDRIWGRVPQEKTHMKVGQKNYFL